MEDAIRKAIEHQSRKLIARQHARQASAAGHRLHFEKRTGQTATVPHDEPPAIWSVHPHFDPAYCIQHSKYLARVIWKKIVSRTYKTTPAVSFRIPKTTGGFRSIMSFSIPDTAIANIFNRKLRDRNKNIQSPYCYSYRPDRDIFDAIIRTSSLIKEDKTFVVNFDFRDYFDSISHAYLKFVMESGEFFISPLEAHVISAFLEHEFASLKDYEASRGARSFERRQKGTPQGCSLSLFLSNIAAHELDKRLERVNGSFVRYADDIVSFAETLEDAVSISQAIKDHGHYSGIKINEEKSAGICLLCDGSVQLPDQSFHNGVVQQLSVVSGFNYLGHRFSYNVIAMSDKAVRRIKTRLSRIIYIHLLENPRRNMFDVSRVGNGFYDWDLVKCLNEMRSYIYGGSTEIELSAFLEANVPISRFKGLMKFYALVNRADQFVALDGWLLSAVRRAHREREKILRRQFDIRMAPLQERDLLHGGWYDYEAVEMETHMPSFILAWRAARKRFKQSGSARF